MIWHYIRAYTLHTYYMFYKNLKKIEISIRFQNFLFTSRAYFFHIKYITIMYHIKNAKGKETNKKNFKVQNKM